MPRDALRKSHIHILLNDHSSKMESRLDKALELTEQAVRNETGLTIKRIDKLYVKGLVQELNRRYAKQIGVEFDRAFKMTDNSWLKPDGGFWYVEDWPEPRRWILVAEAKRQGTNDARAQEGLPKQAKGNAIERLGKNMRGFDALFLGEDITPFVCFGEGCDFAPDSSILDRVSTLNGFFPLNRVFVDKIKLPDGTDVLKPASLFFRCDPWTPKEMHDVLLPVCLHAIEHYRRRYRLR